ncbi:hypothetical protein XBKB1_2380049 [Xenorhabdus bovienii str. kraussei Becker Underwood]|uniref:Uncharacterized protein n=1 Tax=Xenorhabdus bovienii str. kraussei Becker Underwood TaxID=1398204 RepID=A0A077PT17_XENBV|nr:hypothetical protein XBKB1_2380049 [Xenorhabdus bovienii str. kraussei Becker Underwood]
MRFAAVRLFIVMTDTLNGSNRAEDGSLLSKSLSVAFSFMAYAFTSNAPLRGV